MDGIERIKILSSQVKDEALLAIVNYLITREDMNDKYLNEEKSLKQMIDFITGEARKIANNNRAIVKDEVVYGWAIHYWDESNEALGLKKSEVKSSDNKTKEKKVNRTEESKPSIESVTTKKKSKEWVAEGQLSLFSISDEICI